MTCLSTWLPKISAAGLPVPQTEIIESACELTLLLDGIMPDGYADFIARLESARQRLDAGNGAVFLRTGYTSHKHDWRNSCYLPQGDDIRAHVVNLVEFSSCCDMMGLPVNVWAVRELLPTMPIGACPDYEGMPVCREFRLFVHDAEFRCCHPYWPLDALEQGGFATDTTDDWYEHFCALHAAETAEIRDLASRAGAAVGGDWSVDVLDTKHGWYVIDMAHATRSFHWPGCSHEVK